MLISVIKRFEKKVVPLQKTKDDLEKQSDIYLLKYKGASTMCKGEIWIRLLCQIIAPYIFSKR